MLMNEMSNNKWYVLYKQATDIEGSMTERRSKVFEKCKKKYPDIKYKNYAGLRSGIRYKKLNIEIIDYINDDIEYLLSLAEEAKQLRKESDELLAQKHNNENPVVYKPRKVLDPKIDKIPKDDYSKLYDCNIYPLRNSCNFGENESSTWERCEYMKYDNSQSISSSSRWQCTYKKN
jgi:hypothetical protein